MLFFHKIIMIQTLADILIYKWFAFNDHKVEMATKSEVLGARAYLLFYIIRSI